MAVRRRLRGEITTGYPFPRFVRFCKRFGQSYATFETPKMQVLAGKAKPVKGPGECAIMYWNKPAVEEELAQAEEAHLTEYASALKEVLAKWPSWIDTSKLPRGAYTD